MEFLWHDYETYGTHPALDRPCQFAAQRTDANLEPVGEAVVMYCAPADDVLPHPMACLVTGITPQVARRQGCIEADFARQIHTLMTRPNTCSAGYNSLRFDDEVTRNLFYRNLLDPYEREWKDGNSRWDLINLARMCYALRPEGVEWPVVENGVEDGVGVDEAKDASRGAGLRPSFRLQDLSRANHIVHEEAHDALSDVRATIALARLIRAAQPRLFEWALSLRDKRQVKKLLDPEKSEPVVHTSGRIPSARGCTTLVMPLLSHPTQDKAVIVFDLMGEAEALVEGGAEAIRDRVFTPTRDLPDGVSRVPLKKVKWNAVPMVAPMGVLAGVDLERIGLDLARCEANAALIGRHIHTVRRNVQEAFHVEFEVADTDPELAIYNGGFFSDSDRALMSAIHRCTPAELAERSWSFRDSRLPLMLLRFRARNWPETLSPAEWDAWRQDRKRRLTQPPGGTFFGIKAFKVELAEVRAKSRGQSEFLRILDALEAWAEGLGLED